MTPRVRWIRARDFLVRVLRALRLNGHPSGCTYTVDRANALINLFWKRPQ